MKHKIIKNLLIGYTVILLCITFGSAISSVNINEVLAASECTSEQRASYNFVYNEEYCNSPYEGASPCNEVCLREVRQHPDTGNYCVIDNPDSCESGNEDPHCVGRDHCANGIIDCGETGLNCGGGGCDSCETRVRCEDNITWCETYWCPNGDTNGDRQCTLADSGARKERRSGRNCPSLNGACGQIDYFTGSEGDYNNFCYYSQYKLTNCGGDGGGGEPPNSEPNPGYGISIQKKVRDDNGQYVENERFSVGEEIQFRVRINNSNTNGGFFNSLSFEDSYDNRYLNFSSGNIVFENGATRNLNGFGSLSTQDNGNNRIIRVGNMFEFNDSGSKFNIGETYTITLFFTTLAPVSITKNEAGIVARFNGSNERSARDGANVEIYSENNFTVVKDLHNQPDNSFEVGETIPFVITLQNTSANPLNTVRFIDEFDSRYLQYINDSIRITHLPSNSTISGDVGNNVVSSDGRLEISNVLNAFSQSYQIDELDPNEQLVFRVDFNAVQNTSTESNSLTRNNARIVISDKTISDFEDVKIIDFVGCNEICNANTLICEEADHSCTTVGNESRCRLVENPSSTTCQPAEAPDLDIDKILNDADGRVKVGDELSFTIRIINNSSNNYSFNEVYFDDEFDDRYLEVDLRESEIRKSDGTVEEDLSSIANIQNSDTVIIDDITRYLGNLDQNEYFDVKLGFTALRETTSNSGTINEAFVKADDIEDRDEDNVIIDDEEVQIQNCNETCGGNLICNSESDLICVNLGGDTGSRCRLETNIQSTTCEGQTDENPNISIHKNARNDSDGDTVFEVGDTITFDITIRNNGDTELIDVEFSDRFTESIIDYSSGSVKKYDASGNEVAFINQLSSILTINSDGFIEVNDLAQTDLGTLLPGQYYIVTVQFKAKAPGSTTNTATVDAQDKSGNDLPEIDSHDNISVQNLNTDM